MGPRTDVRPFECAAFRARLPVRPLVERMHCPLGLSPVGTLGVHAMVCTVRQARSPSSSKFHHCKQLALPTARAPNRGPRAASPSVPTLSVDLVRLNVTDGMLQCNAAPKPHVRLIQRCIGTNTLGCMRRPMCKRLQRRRAMRDTPMWKRLQRSTCTKRCWRCQQAHIAECATWRQQNASEAVCAADPQGSEGQSRWVGSAHHLGLRRQRHHTGSPSLPISTPWREMGLRKGIQSRHSRPRRRRASPPIRGRVRKGAAKDLPCESLGLRHWFRHRVEKAPTHQNSEPAVKGLQKQSVIDTVWAFIGRSGAARVAAASSGGSAAGAWLVPRAQPGVSAVVRE